jgi:hypothetical protein
MRDKDLTAAIGAFEDPLVLVVGTVTPEDDEREARRNDELPVGIDVDELGEISRQPLVLALYPAQSLGALAAEQRPQLQ